jgi:hypothetical protein
MTLTADDRIILIRVKVERAKKHLSDLEAELTSFRDSHHHALTADVDRQSGRMSHEFGKHRILPFDALAAAGDVVHNLRSALDYLAGQLVWVGSGEEPSRRVEFPIAKDASTYEGDKARKVEGMCPKAIKAIDALKPYKGGNDVLWRIHELDNIDKHRTLFTYSHDCFLVADWLKDITPYPYNLKANNSHFDRVFDDEVERDVEFEMNEAVSEAKVATCDALLPSLHQLVNFVEGLIPVFKQHLG